MLKLITPPTVLPLHLDEVKQHLREDLSENDGLINIYLQQALEEAHNLTQRQMIAARYQYVINCFPACCIDLPIEPLIQVVSIDYTDANGAAQTLPANNYVITGDYSKISPAYNVTWPIARLEAGAVKITFDAGYVAPAVADITTDTVALTGWKTLQANDVLRFSNSGGILPSPLKPKKDYYVKSVSSPGVYTLSATAGGTQIDLTDAGAGLHYAGQIGLNSSYGEVPAGILSWLLLKTETLYSYRGGLVNTPGSVITKNPYMDCLLDPYRKMVI